MRCVAFVAVTMAFLPVSASANFSPKISDVCVETRAGKLLVNRPAFVAQLIQKQVQVAPIDMRPDGQAVTYDMEADALIDPEGFCKANKCAPGVAGKLGHAMISLYEFLTVNASQDHDKNYLVIHPGSPESFLRGADGLVTIECLGPVKQQQAAAEFPETAAEAPRHYFGIRKNVDDFRYAQDDPNFKKLERASLSLQQDYIADSLGIGVNGVAGYTFGPAPIGRSQLRITPFVSYDQDYVNAADKTKDKGVYDLGEGLTADLLFPIGEFYQDMQVYPKFVHSFRNGAETLVTTAVYSPEPAWPFLGQVTYLVPNLLSAQFTPQLAAAYGNVYDDGGDAATLEKGDYFRWGPKIAVALYGEQWLKGFVFNASYETYWVSNAKISSLERFETSVDYTIGEKELWALQLKYVDGQDLDTWDDEKQITLGAGLKY